MDFEALAKKLNKNCLYKNDTELFEKWNDIDLDYNIDECRSYCYSIYNSYDRRHDKYLCESCENILSEEIWEIYNKSNIEICLELEKTKKEILFLKEKIDKLESLIQTLLEKN